MARNNLTGLNEAVGKDEDAVETVGERQVGNEVNHPLCRWTGTSSGCQGDLLKSRMGSDREPRCHSGPRSDRESNL